MGGFVCRRQELNLWPAGYESAALTIWATPTNVLYYSAAGMGVNRVYGLGLIVLSGL